MNETNVYKAIFDQNQLFHDETKHVADLGFYEIMQWKLFLYAYQHEIPSSLSA